jgi:hypothetical protein
VITPADIPPRYPVTPQHPPLRVRVIIQFNGSIYKAARVFHPRTKKLVWLAQRREHSTQQTVERYLPPRGKKGLDWPDNPEWWQPEQPDKWEAPLPTPLVIHAISKEGIMADIGRGARRRRRDALLVELREDLPWWWMVDPDAPRIVYEPPGAVTRDMAEGRVMRAVSASGAQQTANLFRRELPPPAFALLTEAAQAVIRDEATKREKHPPSRWWARLHLDAADLKDWLTAMSWFAALNPPDLRGLPDADGKWDDDDTTRPWSLNDRQQVLIARARCVGGPMSWRSMGEWMGIHESRCRQLYESAIDRVLRAANGLHAVHDQPVDHLAAIREANRAYKRGPKMQTFKCGDHVKHRPSGETWVVAYADNEHVACCGWPETLAQASDCTLVKAATNEQHVDMLKRCATLDDSRGSHARAEIERMGLKADAS